ncbi:MAG: hypothetical protein ACKVOJ_14260 [Sphingomonadaceae bacterium]
MSVLGDALAGIRNVMLMQSDVERLQREITQTAADLRGLRDYTTSIDMRVTRLEGMIEGAAIVAGRQPRLPNA